MSQIKISVIIPVYNMERYLKKCLDSVVNQTLEGIEIIIIDDGSTDSSSSIIAEYRAKYPDKIISLRKANGGQGAARNVGIDVANGEYIGFVDADDYIEKEMYECLYKKAVELECDYVECDYTYVQEINGIESELDKYGEVRERRDKRELFINPLVSPWNKIYKSEILKDNQIRFPEGVIYEDTSFYIKAIPFLNKIGYVDEVFVRHFLRSNSTMTGSKSVKTADIFNVIDDYLDFYRKMNFKNEYMSELEFFTVKILLCSSMERISKIAEKDLKKKYIYMSWHYINKYFPDYKKNKYLDNSSKSIYMKCANIFVLRLFVRILSMKNRIRSREK